MANGWRSRAGLVMAGLMVGLMAAVTIGLTASPASACSFAFRPDLAIVGSPQAGGNLHIIGRGFVGTDGDVSASCGGDYDFVPAPPITLIVDFTTLSGPRSVALTAPVDGPRIPHEDAEAGFEAAYTIDATTAVPPDATAVAVRVDGWFGGETEAEISGAVATTVTTAPVTPVAPVAPQSATPATAVAGDPSFTG